jgi:site-specific recombinase XerD
VRGEEAGPLLCPVNRGGRVVLRRMTGQAVRLVLGKRAAQARIGATTPHDLRRTFVGDLLDAGADIVTAQGLAGHAQVTTTAAYDRRPAATRRKAAELLHVPYRRRTPATAPRSATAGGR